jgi:hypothetical protein
MGLNKSVIVVMIAIFLLGFSTYSPAQVEDLVERYAGENADGFLRPLITAFGSNVNSGLYRSAHVPKMGLHFNIAINGMVALIPSSQRTFQATTTGYFYPVQTVEAPTVMGDPAGVIVTSPSGTAYAFPGGFDTKTFLIGMPTITVGSIFGTEGSIRFFKARLNDDIGDISLFGIGGRHSISQYIHMSPVDIAAGVFFHKFKIGDVVDSDVLAIHAEVGKSFTTINVYGGLAYETTKAKAEYTFDSGSVTEDVNVDITGDNKFRVTLGLGFNFGLFHWNVDYNIGNQQVINTGISIGI